MPSRLVSQSLPARPRHPPGHAAPSWRRPRRSTGCLAHPGASPGSNCSPHWTTLPEPRPKPPRDQPSLGPQPWTTTPAPCPIPQWTTPQPAAAPTEPPPPTAVPSRLPTRRPGHSSWTSRNPPGPIWREALPAPTPPVTHLGRVPAPAAPTILSKKFVCFSFSLILKRSIPGLPPSSSQGHWPLCQAGQNCWGLSELPSPRQQQTHIWSGGSGGCLGTPTRHRRLLLGSWTANPPPHMRPVLGPHWCFPRVPCPLLGLSMSQPGSVQGGRKLRNRGEGRGV